MWGNVMSGKIRLYDKTIDEMTSALVETYIAEDDDDDGFVVERTG